jgi:hypothetical protein
MLEVTVARAVANNDVVLEVRDDDEKVAFEKYCGHVFDDVFLVRDMTEIRRGQEACQFFVFYMYLVRATFNPLDRSS